ncbi:FadR/GntR family transcriptional regulator [Propionicimonas sp.]|uniref:FadR/GntR family transcriptional regulator n=1 Tax=Propionicimonas sp. TaxID=1955623 RepID=UPI0039E323B9
MEAGVFDGPGDGELFGQLPQRTAISGVASRLLAYLTSGDIPVGTRLPPERELSAKLGVGRSAIRGALAALEVLGIIDVRPGSGSYVAGTTSELLPQTLTWGMLVSPQSTEELLEIRSHLEVLVAAGAATSATEADLDYLEECVTTLEQAVDDIPAFVTADFKFHDRLARVAGNEITRQLLSTARSLLRIWVDRSVSRGQQMAQTIAEHRAILEAVRSGDPAVASASMAAHMRTATERLRTFSGSDAEATTAAQADAS